MLTARPQSRRSLPPSGIVLVVLVGLAVSTPATAQQTAEQPATEELEASATDELEITEPETTPGGEESAEDATFPWTGEELYYSVRINDAEAMRGGLRVGQVESHGPHSYVPLSGSAQSRGFLDAAYPIDDTANTYLDPETTFPLRTEKTFNENGQFRSYNVDYRHVAYTAAVERHREESTSSFESPIPRETHDMMSWLYELRQVDDLAIGDRFNFYIYDGWLLTNLQLEVVDRVEILTPIGWFKTWKFDFTRQIKEAEENTDQSDDGENQPRPPELTVDEEARHTGSLWLSRDENKIPVKVTIDTTFGAGDVILIHYEPGEPG